MATKNFALAFQIAATFNGNKAFLDAIVKTQELSNKMKDCQKQMESVYKAYNNGTIGVGSRGNAQKQIGNAYTAAANQKARYEKLATAQNKFESSYGNMTKYGANMYQFYEMAKGVMAVADAAVDFQGKMSKVQAITKSSGDQMDKLRQQAMELGKKTQFSASQAADAMSYLGMAGWNTNQILEGMPGLLNLAAASGSDLATVADIISDDLTAFGMSANQAGHMADVFAAASTNANTNVELMGETFKYCAPLAGALKYDLEDIAVATGLMANAGVKGSQAGTALRSTITRLTKPTKESGIAMDALGISVTNSDGTMKPFMQTMEELRDAFAGLTEEEKARYAAQIAGQEAMSGFLAIVNAAPDDFSKLSRAITNCKGASSKMADTMTNNAQGKIVAFKSAIESLKISVGNNLLPILAQGAQVATSFAVALGDLSNKYPGLISGTLTLGLTIAGLGAVGNAAMWIYGGLKTVYYGVSAASAALTIVLNAEKRAQAMTTAATWLSNNAHWAYAAGSKIAAAAQWLFNSALLACPLTWIAAGIAAVVAAGYLLYKNWDTVTKFMGEAWEWVCNKIIYGIGYIVGWFATLPERISYFFNNLGPIGEQFINSAKEWGKRAVDGLINWFTNLPERLGNIVSSAWNRAKLAFSAGEESAKATVPVAHNATGGIYGKGAFLTTFAEDSGESAIPHTPNARNIGLLAKTNEIMGNPLGGSNINATFAPNITVQGGGDAAQLQQVLESEMERFKRMLQDLQNQQRRLSYA